MKKNQGIRRAFRLAVVPLMATGLMMAQQAPPPMQPPGQAPAPRLTPPQLDTLVAPVALYPDNLLGQILAASTYPLEITEAEQWLQQNPTLQGQQLVAAAQQQNWDPSVQALVVFPDVLSRLASDIRWTTDLGNAFLTQQADVMNAVQRMRASAMAAGKLQSNSDQTVTTQTQGDQSAIDIAPANPDVVNVPYYNPEYIWGPPDEGGYYPPWDYLDLGYGYDYGFGPPIYIGAFFGGLGWGGWGWGLNWFTCGLFLHGPFFGRYGFHGYGIGGGLWAHNGFHREGVGYPNRALAARYGAASAAGARAAFSGAGARYSAGNRGGATAGGGWNRFSAGGGSSGYRASPSGGNYARNATPSYRGSYSFSGRSAMPSYGGYRGSYGGYRGSYGGGYHYAAPSYRGSSGGGYHSSGGFHSSGGGFHGGGGGFHGGGGGFHGGGGGHGGGGRR